MIDIKIYNNKTGNLESHFEVMEENHSTIFSEAIDRIAELQGRASGTYGFNHSQACHSPFLTVHN